MISNKKIDTELQKILKPIKCVQIDFDTPGEVVLSLIYNRNKKSTAAVIKYNLEKGDTPGKIFDEIRPILDREYIETHGFEKS